MLRRGLALLVALPLCLLVGCGGPDLSKQTFQRTTVPAGGAPGSATDPRLNAANLRPVDPCRVLGKLALRRYGGAGGQPQADDMSSCTQSLGSEPGKTKYVSLKLGESLSAVFTPFKTKIAGLPANELDTGMCSESVLTDSEAGIGFELQYNADGSNDNCAPARALAAELVDRLRRDPPKRSTQGTLALVQPCDTVDGGTVSGILGNSVDGEAVGLHECEWDGDALALKVGFTVGSQPSGKDKADLGGGVRAVREPAAKGCRVGWAHKPAAGGKQELAQVEVSVRKHSGADLCAGAVKAAKVVRSRLPTA